MAVGVPSVPPLRRRYFPSISLSGDLAGRLRRLGKLELVALTAFTALTLFLLFVPLFVPHGEAEIVGRSLTSPAGGHLMGTDEQSRDVLSRVLLGMRTSWFSAFGVIASGIVIGGTIGLVAGMTGGWVDNVLMRLTDVFLAMPGPLLVLAVVSALGASLQHTLLAVAIVWWPFYARIIRGEVKAIASKSHVEAARMGGASRWRIAFKHVVPGTFGAVLVTASLDIGALLLTLAGLSFLGLGSPPPAAELGSMSARGLSYLFTSWWVPVFPALGVFVLAFIGNLAGDAVRDVVEG